MNEVIVETDGCKENDREVDSVFFFLVCRQERNMMQLTLPLLAVLQEDPCLPEVFSFSSAESHL
jgi:hypothetical protein